MTAAYHHTGVFSIKNPTIESEVSWSSLLSFYTLEEQSFQHVNGADVDCVTISTASANEEEWTVGLLYFIVFYLLGIKSKVQGLAKY